MELSEKKQKKLESLAVRYKSHETFIIARETRKTIRFIEKNTENFPNKYLVLKNKIISSCYEILEWVYRANIMNDKNDKKEIVVYIQMLNFYLEEALRKGILSNKKFLSYTSYLFKIDKMVRSWFKYETL